MTSPKQNDIPAQPAAGDTGKRDRALSDNSLEQVTGGVSHPDATADQLAEDRQIEQYDIDNAHPRSPSDLPDFEK